MALACPKCQQRGTCPLSQPLLRLRLYVVYTTCTHYENQQSNFARWSYWTRGKKFHGRPRPVPGRNVLYSRSVCGSYNLLVLTSMSNTTRGASWSWLRDACCSCRLVPAAPGQPLSRRCSLRCRQSSSPRSNGITIGSPARRGVRSVIRANTVRQMALSRFCFCSAARRNRSGRRPM